LAHTGCSLDLLLLAQALHTIPNADVYICCTPEYATDKNSPEGPEILFFFFPRLRHESTTSVLRKILDVVQLQADAACTRGGQASNTDRYHCLRIGLLTYPTLLGKRGATKQHFTTRRLWASPPSPFTTQPFCSFWESQSVFPEILGKQAISVHLPQFMVAYLEVYYAAYLLISFVL
jgi:hypothetical protein